MEDLTAATVKFFDNEARTAFALACGAVLSGDEVEARRLFRQSVALRFRADREKQASPSP